MRTTRTLRLKQLPVCVLGERERERECGTHTLQTSNDVNEWGRASRKQMINEFHSEITAIFWSMSIVRKCWPIKTKIRPNAFRNAQHFIMCRSFLVTFIFQNNLNLVSNLICRCSINQFAKVGYSVDTITAKKSLVDSTVDIDVNQNIRSAL